MPLKEIHLRPTSRMISAASTVDEDEEATRWRRERDSGELRVKVAAVCSYQLVAGVDYRIRRFGWCDTYGQG